MMAPSSTYENITLVVPRPSSGHNPHHAHLIRSLIPTAIPASHVLIRIDRFGFSANNITYQALGEEPHFRYFDFHRAPEESDVRGVIPVWGFGTVVASSIPQIGVGERVFGYLAMARYALLPVDPADINAYNFYVPRSHLPSDRRPYNQLTRCARDALYTPASEDLAMLFRPLFWTSFWTEDWLYTGPDVPYSGADTVVITSASAKTAFCLAYRVQVRKQAGAGVKRMKVIGLTSRGNVAFTRGLGLYDVVLPYDNLEELKEVTGSRWLYVDVAGDDELNARVHSSVGGRLVRCVSLGATNLSPAAAGTGEGGYKKPASGVTQASPSPSTSAPSPSTSTQHTPSTELFFMPEWLAQRRLTLSAASISATQREAWGAFVKDCEGGWTCGVKGGEMTRRPWVTIERTWGAEKVGAAYKRMVGARRGAGLGPEKGLVWSMWGEEQDGLRGKL